MQTIKDYKRIIKLQFEDYCGLMPINKEFHRLMIFNNVQT